MSETVEHQRVCEYLGIRYPETIFFSDMSGVRLGMRAAIVQSKLKSSRGIPDLFIMKPNKKYYALIIEIKKTGQKLKKKNGDWVSEHVKEQAEVIDKLNASGYYACFGVGEEECIKIIDEYMEDKL